MNFSENRKLRRTLSLILVLVLLTTLFAGCKKKETPEDTSEPGLNLNLSEPPAPTETQTEPTETTGPKINENTAVVTAALKVRNWPSLEGSIEVGTLQAGDRVEISRFQHSLGTNWAYIISPIDGWIVTDYIEMDIPSQNPTQEDTSTPAGNNSAEPTQPSDNNTENIKGVINTNGLNIRSEPINGKIQGSYNKGDVVTILEVRNGWGRTNKGWIKMDYVNTTGDTANNNTTTNNNNNSTNNAGNGSTTVQFKGIVTASELNIRSSASTEGTRVGSLSYGTRVEILERSGNWGRTKDGWISLDYVYQDGTTGKKTANGIVTGSNLNIRSGPGTGYASVGSMNAGDRVNILEQITIGDTTWGCTSKGWISLQYVYVDGTGTGNNKLATVTGDNLNIRSGPGTNYGAVGSLSKDEVVTILYQVTVGDTTWGNIDRGWIAMQYVSVDSNS